MSTLPALASGLPDPATFVKAPKLISDERFHEMLNILPPQDWRGGGASQSFKMCEFIYDDITTIFCKHGGLYFELCDSYQLTHAQIIDKCVAIRIDSQFPAIDPLS